MNTAQAKDIALRHARRIVLAEFVASSDNMRNAVNWMSARGHFEIGGKVVPAEIAWDNWDKAEWKPDVSE